VCAGCRELAPGFLLLGGSTTEFIDENGGGPGVRPRHSKKAQAIRSTEERADLGLVISRRSVEKAMPRPADFIIDFLAFPRML
jgi:hypothetical protein